ncbi:MAG: DNA gyrase subunit A [Mycoplasma sp.]
MEENKNLILKSVSNEIRNSFLNYSMSVIVSRALPDLRDGLKPVHRRILYSMFNIKNFHNSSYKKSARIVGDVIGKYHPHGDSSVYDAIVRMAQDFNMRYLLIDGHGNFGSIDGDSAAAMRYTEIRMKEMSSEMLSWIEKDTVRFVDNYDETEKEPSVLPSLIPNLLLNGSSGIAVGMATNIPPHNLNNVIDALILQINDDSVDIEKLIDAIQGPDFPTGGYVSSPSNIRKIYRDGSGSVTIQAKVDILEEERILIVKEIPYQTNKARIIERIAELVNDKIIEGISDIKDESNYEGIRIVIKYKKGFESEVVLNNLFKHTSLRTHFSCHFLALLDGQPKTFNLKEILEEIINFQVEILVKKTRFELKAAEQRIHLLLGIKKAVEDIDKTVRILKESRTSSDAISNLCDQLEITQVQAKAILDMKMQRLVGLEKEKLDNEVDELTSFINKSLEILECKNKQLEIIKNSFLKIKEKFGDERRSEITEDYSNIEDEDLIKREDIVVLMTQSNYIKRIPVEEYKLQNRGGVGTKSLSFYEDDVTKLVTSGSTHDDYMFFTKKGFVYRIKGYKIFSKSKQSKGIPIINLLKTLEKDDDIKEIINVSKEDYNANTSLSFITKSGLIKKTSILHYARINVNGKIAISLRENDEIVNVLKTTKETKCIVVTSNGKGLRFDASLIRDIGRSSQGVKAIKLLDNSYVVSAANDSNSKYLLIITEKGMGKLNLLDEGFRIKGRGTQGYNLISKSNNDRIVYSLSVNENDEILLVTEKGISNRININDIRVTKSKSSKGVIIMNLKDDDKIISATVIGKSC